jgi:hypothetical protein
MAISDLLDKKKYVDIETRRKRINVCINCPTDNYYEPTKQCKLCFCFIRQKAKLKKEYEDCPNGHW